MSNTILEKDSQKRENYNVRGARKVEEDGIE